MFGSSVKKIGTVIIISTFYSVSDFSIEMGSTEISKVLFSAMDTGISSGVGRASFN